MGQPRTPATERHIETIDFHGLAASSDPSGTCPSNPLPVYGYLLATESDDTAADNRDIQTHCNVLGLDLQRTFTEHGRTGPMLQQLLANITRKPGTVVTPSLRHFAGRADLLRLYVPVWTLNPSRWWGRVSVDTSGAAL